MNRGSDSVRASNQGWYFRFNEAPIHESGKCAAHFPQTPQLRGFNEAPIHESGKSDGQRIQLTKVAGLQ